MSNDWFDELLKDANLRSKRKREVNNEVNNDVAKDVKIRIKNLDLNNVIVIVTYNYNNGTKTLTLHPQQRLNDFLTQVTTKRDIDVLKYVVKTLKAYADMNNVLKELMTFDLDDFYENNVKKRRIKLTNVNLNVNNIIKQNNINNYDEQNDVNEDNYDEQQNNNAIEQQNDNEQNDYDKQLLQQLRSLINDLNNVNLNDVNDNDELFNAANYVIQRFLMFLINVNDSHDGVINNVINYLRKHIDNGDRE